MNFILWGNFYTFGSQRSIKKARDDFFFDLALESRMSEHRIDIEKCSLDGDDESANGGEMVEKGWKLKMD